MLHWDGSHTTFQIVWEATDAETGFRDTTNNFPFKLPLNLREPSVSGLSVNSEEANIIRSAKLTIWNEAPMEIYVYYSATKKYHE